MKKSQFEPLFETEIDEFVTSTQKIQDCLSGILANPHVLSGEGDNNVTHAGQDQNKPYSHGIHFPGSTTMKTQTAAKKSVREIKSLRTEAAGKKVADRGRCCRCCRCCRGF